MSKNELEGSKCDKCGKKYDKTILINEQFNLVVESGSYKMVCFKCSDKLQG